MKPSHISDEDLVRALDQELSDEHSLKIDRHLNQCELCRNRYRHFEQSKAQFTQYYGESTRVPEAATDSAAASLRTKLIAAAEPGRARLFGPLALVAACSAMILAGAIYLGGPWRFLVSGPDRPLPDARLTPGATRPVVASELCALPSDDDARIVPAQLAQQVFRNYGIRQPRPRAYEVDFLITPSLGGAEDPRNLWPQPYGGSMWTAREKDALEDRLRTLVCAGEIDLATAQQEIASNWILAYQKYFSTRTPLPAHAAFLKDKPWE